MVPAADLASSYCIWALFARRKFREDEKINRWSPYPSNPSDLGRRAMNGQGSNVWRLRVQTTSPQHRFLFGFMEKSRDMCQKASRKTLRLHWQLGRPKSDWQALIATPLHSLGFFPKTKRHFTEWRVGWLVDRVTRQVSVLMGWYKTVFKCWEVLHHMYGRG